MCDFWPDHDLRAETLVQYMIALPEGSLGKELVDISGYLKAHMRGYLLESLVVMCPVPGNRAASPIVAIFLKAHS